MKIEEISDSAGYNECVRASLGQLCELLPRELILVSPSYVPVLFPPKPKPVGEDNLV